MNRRRFFQGLFGGAVAARVTPLVNFFKPTWVKTTYRFTNTVLPNQAFRSRVIADEALQLQKAQNDITNARLDAVKLSWREVEEFDTRVKAVSGKNDIIVYRLGPNGHYRST